MSEGQTQQWLPLPRLEVIRALGKQGPSRIPARTPFDNIEAFLDEAVRYGTAHRAQIASSS